MTNTSRRMPGLDTSLRNLAISSADRPTSSKAVADTWEEAASSSSSRSNSPSPPYSPTDAVPGAPPPTPISPTYSHSRHRSTDWSVFANAHHSSSSTPPRFSEGSDKRPEKSSAAAGRLIAGALGVKSPKKTEESKAYERAVREKERKRREVAKDEAEKAKREKEEARKAIWEG